MIPAQKQKVRTNKKLRTLGVLGILLLTGAASAIADPAVSSTSQATVNANDSFVYTVTVSNAGDAKSQAIATKVTLPKGLAYAFTDSNVSGGNNVGVSTDASTGITTLTIPSIGSIDQNGNVYDSNNTSIGTGNARYRLHLIGSTTPAGQLTPTASITVVGDNASTANDSSSFNVTVNPNQSGAGNSACIAAGGTLSPTNLLTNANFGTLSGSGYSDLSSTGGLGLLSKAPGSPYIYQGGGTPPNLLISETRYLITNQQGSGSKLNIYGPWQPYFGHTTGDANDVYLAVNGSDKTTAAVVTGTVNVGTSNIYDIGIYARSPHAADSPYGGLGNGAILLLTSTAGTSTATGKSTEIVRGSPWTRYGIVLGSGQSGTLTFTIGSSVGQVQGNDYYLDDVYVDQCTLPTGTVKGTVFTDSNASKTFDAGESPISNATVTATDFNGAQYTTTTDSTGAYLFTLPGALGSYTITVTSPAGLSATTPTTYSGVAITNGSSVQGGDFGYAPALSITKAVDAANIKVSDDPLNTGTAVLGSSSLSPAQLTYTLTVKNLTAGTVTGAAVTDTLPKRLSYVAQSTQGASEPAVSGQTLTFTVPTLAANGTQTISFKANVSNMTANTAQNQLSNTAQVLLNGSAATSAPALTNVIYPKLQKTVRNVTLGQSASSTAVQGLPGQVMEYCLNFNNYSSVALPNFVLTDNVPRNTNPKLDAYGAGLGIKLSRTTSAGTTASTLTSVADADGGQLTSTLGNNGNGALTVNLGTLAPGDSGTACFQATIK